MVSAPCLPGSAAVGGAAHRHQPLQRLAPDATIERWFPCLGSRDCVRKPPATPG
jgi:hypothetical protein